MSYRLELSIPGLPKNANARLHWRARYRENQTWKDAVGALCAGKRPQTPLLKAKITCIRYSSVPSDYDNIVAGFKPVIDGLVEAGILVDDSMDHLVRREYLWEKAPPKAGRIHIIVEEATG